MEKRYRNQRESEKEIKIKGLHFQLGPAGKILLFLGPRSAIGQKGFLLALEKKNLRDKIKKTFKQNDF